MPSHMTHHKNKVGTRAYEMPKGEAGTGRTQAACQSPATIQLGLHFYFPLCGHGDLTVQQAQQLHVQVLEDRIPRAKYLLHGWRILLAASESGGLCFPQ